MQKCHSDGHWFAAKVDQHMCRSILDMNNAIGDARKNVKELLALLVRCEDILGGWGCLRKAIELHRLNDASVSIFDIVGRHDGESHEGENNLGCSQPQVGVCHARRVEACEGLGSVVPGRSGPSVGSSRRRWLHGCRLCVLETTAIVKFFGLPGASMITCHLFLSEAISCPTNIFGTQPSLCNAASYLNPFSSKQMSRPNTSAG